MNTKEQVKVKELSEEVRNRAKEVFYSGVLHDIGKPFQKVNFDFGENLSKSHIRQGIEVANFIFNNKPSELIENSIRFHHAINLQRLEGSEDKNKYNPLVWIIYEADNIASACDRREREEKFNLQNIEEKEVEESDKEEKIFNNKPYFCKSLPLESIFSSAIYKEKNGDKEFYFKHDFAKDLNFYELINFPRIKDNKFEWSSAKQTYEYICNEFINQIKKDKRFSQNPNAFLQLLEACYSYLPSDTYTGREPDISLYEHLKLTSAIALCIYYYLNEKNGLSKENIINHTHWDHKETHRNINQFLLVSGDLSGIQNFIYNISSDKALKSLRARSFYLEMLMEYFVDNLLKDLGIFRSNLIFLGGGHFYMILPNTELVKNILEENVKELNNFLLEFFSTKLYLAIGYEECSANDLMAENKESSNLKKKWKHLSQKLASEKVSRYKERLEEILYMTSSSGVSECKVCKKDALVEDLNENMFCSVCNELAYHGEKLVKESEFWIITAKNKIDTFNSGLLSRDNFKILPFETNKKIDDSEQAYSVNQWGSGIEGKYNSTILLGNYVKKTYKDTRDTIDFETLANKSIGDKKIGVLRADVDNLGQLFTSGIKEKLVSISRYAVLSRSLSMFFKLYLNKICERKEIKKLNDIYSGNYKFPYKFIENQADIGNFVTVYSGGDDLFIVGAWNEVLELAIDIRESFKTYTCGKCTLSAGIGIFDHNYPLYLMAEKTDELEKEAKNNDGKDSISILDKDLVFKWDDFINIMNLMKSTFISGENLIKGKLLDYNGSQQLELIYNIDNKELTKSFLYKLLDFTNKGLKRQYKYEEQTVSLARLHYLIAREKERFNLGSKDKNIRKASEEKLDSFYNGFLVSRYFMSGNKEKKLLELKTMLLMLIMFTRGF